MFDAIINNPDLFSIRREECSENGVCVEFCDEIGGAENYIILKVDDYYNTSNFATPPKAVDCLIVIKRDHGYEIVLVELKNVSSTKSIKPGEIEPKFLSTIQDFMGSDFSDIFSGDYDLVGFKTLLVADPWGWANLDSETFKRRIKGSLIDRYLMRKPLVFRGLSSQIKVEMPDPVLC